jgi:hypothetical protein
MEKKVEEEVDALKTRISVLESTLKGFREPPPKEPTLVQKLGQSLV